MPLIIAIICFVIFFCLESSAKSKRTEAFQYYDKNQEIGKTEYLLSWHIFWNEVVPEIYTEYQKEVGQSTVTRSLGIYDQHFEEIGLQLYNRDPSDEAVYRAKLHMRNLGIKPYLNSISWDERHNLRSDARDLLVAPVEQLIAHQYRRPDVTFILNEHEGISVEYKGEIIQIPAADDYRRLFYQGCFNRTPTKLQDKNLPSGLKWRRKERSQQDLENRMLKNFEQQRQ